MGSESPNRSAAGVRAFDQKLNLIATYGSAAATIFWPLLATPFFARHLGPQEWGLVSLSLLILLLATLFEGGFSQAVMREIAALRTVQSAFACAVLMGVRRWYLVAGIVLGSIAVAAAWPASSLVSNSGGLTRANVAVALASAGLMISGQLASAFCRAVLQAFEQHRANSILNIAAQSLRFGVGMLLIQHWPSASVLSLWLAVSAIIEALLRQFSAKSYVGARAVVPSSESEHVRASVRVIVSRGVRMSIAVILGSGMIYLDRFLVAQNLPLRDLGTYTVAATAALGLVQIVYPLGQIALPRMVAASTEQGGRARINLRLAQVIGIMGLLIGLIYATVGASLVRFWLRSAELADSVVPLLDVLVWGALFNALFNIGYWNWIADGNHRAIMKTFSLSFALSAGVTWFLTRSHGLSGAAAGWVLSNFLCMVLSLGWVRFSRARVENV